MFQFEERDDGFFVTDAAGYGVAHVETKTVGETNDPNLKVQKKIITPLNEARIHFTGYKFTLGTLKTFLEEVAAHKE